MLIQNSGASNSPKKQPEARGAAIGYAEGDGHTPHPKKRLKRIHREEAVHSQINRTEEDDHGSEQMRKAPPSEFAHYPRCEQNLSCGR